jgi:hypothetical protein
MLGESRFAVHGALIEMPFDIRTAASRSRGSVRGRAFDWIIATLFFAKNRRDTEMVERRSMAGIAVPLPPLSGTIAFELRKNPGKVTLVDEAAHQSNVRQFEPVSEQQLPSPLQPPSDQPLVGRYASRLAEGT